MGEDEKIKSMYKIPQQFVRVPVKIGVNVQSGRIHAKRVGLLRSLLNPFGSPCFHVLHLQVSIYIEELIEVTPSPAPKAILIVNQYTHRRNDKPELGTSDRSRQ